MRITRMITNNPNNCMRISIMQMTRITSNCAPCAKATGQALILSAGLGNRLKPMTDFIPKPLLPIVDRPVIDINISRLLEFGIENIGFNLFYW